MTTRNQIQSRRDYWTECWFPPSIESLKERGVWDSLPQSIKRSYLDAERYRQENKDKLARFMAVYEESLKMMDSASESK